MISFFFLFDWLASWLDDLRAGTRRVLDGVWVSFTWVECEVLSFVIFEWRSSSHVIGGLKRPDVSEHAGQAEVDDEDEANRSEWR